MTQRDDHVAGLAQAVMTLVDTAHRRISATIDLTRMQVLGLVASDGPIRPADIAERLGLTKSAVSRHLSALQDAEQVSVEADPRDARTFLVSLSKQGGAEIEAATAAGTRRFAQVLTDWTDDEVESAQHSIERLLDAWVKPPVPQQINPTSVTQPRWMRRRIPEGPTS